MHRTTTTAAHLLMASAAAATLILTPGTAVADHPSGVVAGLTARQEPPPGSDIPIGPAVYPGDPVPARFLGRDVRVRSQPDTRDGRIVSVGQRGQRVAAHCYRLMRTSAAGGTATWFYVSHRPNGAAGQRGWVNSRYLRAYGVLDPCSPGV